MGHRALQMMKYLVLAIAVLLACAMITVEAEMDVDIKSLPDQLAPTRAAGLARKDILGRSCMNECGGLCRQLCSKFKALKVCNGCVRGCLSKCDVGHGPKITYDPFNLPAKASNSTKN